MNTVFYVIFLATLNYLKLTKLIVYQRRQKNKIFNLPGGLNILPKVCSEFFYKINLKDTDRVDVVFLFVNDSWFMPYFKQIMKNLAVLISLELRLPIFYINHENLKIIDS